MRWETIQSRLRYKLGELFSQEQSIRSIVRDVDSKLESLVIWNGNPVDCWSGILKEVRLRHLELDLIEAAQLAHPQDEVLQKAKDDFKMLTLGATSTVSSTPTGSVQPPSIDGTGPVNVFISYAEDDEKFKKQLEAHLATLKRDDTIRTLYNQQIELGREWKQETANYIDSAQIILLLVSSSFLASDQIYQNEILRAMERHAEGTARVIPITLRPVELGNTPFQNLQGLPRNHRPIESWRSIDEAWAAIAQEIRQVCKDLRRSTGKH